MSANEIKVGDMVVPIEGARDYPHCDIPITGFEVLAVSVKGTVVIDVGKGNGHGGPSLAVPLSSYINQSRCWNMTVDQLKIIKSAGQKQAKKLIVKKAKKLISHAAKFHMVSVN